MTSICPSTDKVRLPRHGSQIPGDAIQDGSDLDYTQPASIAARPTFFTSPRRRHRPPLPTCTRPSSTGVLSTCRSYCRAEKYPPLPHRLGAARAAPRRTSGQVFWGPHQVVALRAAVVAGQAATGIVPTTTARDQCHALGHPCHRPAARVDTDLDRPLRPDPVPGPPQAAVVRATGAAATGPGAGTATAAETGGEAPAVIAMSAEAVAAARHGDKQSKLQIGVRASESLGRVRRFWGMGKEEKWDQRFPRVFSTRCCRLMDFR